MHVSLISNLDGTVLNWCVQEHLRTQMSETVLFGKIKVLELMKLNLRGPLQCRMGGKREGLIDAYPKFWNLKPLKKQSREILRIQNWTVAIDLVRKELQIILRRDVLPALLAKFSHCEADDVGDEQPDAGAVSASQRGGGVTMKGVHTRLGSPICWVLCSCIFPLGRE